MGGKGGAPTPLLSSSPSAICCMCGDHGLLQELFRCKVCLFRSQHKYCSDLYPKAETYRACNWCLREEGGKPALRESTTDHHNSNPISSSSSNGARGAARGAGVGSTKLHRGPFSLQLNKPIKKQRLPERSSSDMIHRVRSSEDLSSPAGSGRGRHDFRGRVRRYKLLEEVSS